MTDDFAEAHNELRDVARGLLGSGATAAELNWSRLAEAGWLGLEVTEELGGAGATFAEVCVLLQEMGRAASQSAFLGTVALGVGALNLLEGPDPRKWLDEVAAGDLRLAVVLPTGDDTRTPYRLETVDRTLQLHGDVEYVPDAAEADRLLILATDPAGVPVMVSIEAQSPGVNVRVQPLLDATRRFAAVSAAGAPIDPGAVRRFRGDSGEAARGLLERAAVAIACDALGAAEAMLDATVAYAGVRQQFGRFIGSFQAVKHACADMLVQISVGRELLAAAIRAVATAAPDSAVAVAMAKSYVCAVAVDVIGKAMQLHGGYGYTWDSGVHVYLKRAALDRSLFGAPAAHRSRIAARYV